MREPGGPRRKERTFEQANGAHHPENAPRGRSRHILPARHHDRPIDGPEPCYQPTFGAECGAPLSGRLSTADGDPQFEADRRTVEDLRKLPVEDLCRLGYEAAKAKACEAESE